MTDTAVAQALKSITSERLLEHIRVLASDEFEGRKPGTTGEFRSIDYLVNQCKQLNLSLGDPMGGYFQKIPVVGLQAQSELKFTSKEKSLALTKLTDYVARSGKQRQTTQVMNSDVIFVGYGITAPEYGWDDFKGVNVRGKTIVCLIGDPRREDANQPSGFDPTFFKGKALTYYGRWTYKYEMAHKVGADAVFIVHDTDRAGYGFDVVNASWGGENLYLAGDEEHAQVEGWLTTSAAEKLFALAGKDFSALKQAAQQNDFRPVALDTKLHIDMKTEMREFTTCNVVAKIEGSDERLKDECIVYCAHWDHFGKRVDKDGKVGIFSGAADNGSGVSAILEIARAYKQLAEPPRRTIVFLFTTLEEYGLLGAKHYVESPAVPLNQTLCIINLDSMNLWGRTRKFVSIASGHSSLDQILSRRAGEQNREVVPDREPEKGYFFRSDHLEFLRRGIPALFALSPGDDFIDQPADYGVNKRKYYLANDYHKVTDKVKPDWDLSGLREDAQLLFLSGLDVAQADEPPVWNETSEFKTKARSVAQPARR